MLRKPISLLLVVAAIALLALAAEAGPSPGVVKEDLKYIMPLSQVKPGMKAYGLTVFKGVKIERFDVRILGILRKVNNGKDWIMVRMSGGPITGRGANIIQGMSGSPVYINGKIIGAVAYGPGSFSKEPLGMLTPIEDMMDSLDPKLPAKPSGLSSGETTALESPVRIGDQTIKRVEIRDAGSTRPASEGTLVMTPLMTPVMVSGISNRNMAKLADLLEPYGMAPMAGPGAKGDSIPVEFKPGAAIGVALATGDIDMTAVGTVTYRRGNKVIAFGHPMFGIGPIDAPMTTAYVHDVFPSYQISSKIASPIKTIGRIFADRPWSIGGEVGKMATMIPVVVDINDKAIGRKRTVNVKVINHPLLASRLLLMMAAEALTETHGIPGDAMAKVRLEINADQIGKIVRENTFFDPAAIEIGALDDLQGLVNILSDNKFYPLDVKSVRMSVTIESGRKTATVERIFIDKSKYEPGETVNIGVELRPYKSGKIRKDIRLTIPEGTQDGNMMLTVRGGTSGGMGEVAMPMAPPTDPKGPRMIVSSSGTAENIRQIIDKYLEREKNNELVAKLILPGAALSVQGEKLSDLPGPIESIMKSPRSSTIKLEREDVKVVQPMDYIMIGEQMLPIRVERRRVAEKKQAPPAPEPQMPQVISSPPPPSSEEDDQQTDDSGDFSLSTPLELAAPVPAPASKPKEKAPSTEKSTTSTASEDGTKTDDAAADGKADAKSDAKSDRKKADKPVVRQPSVWKQKSRQDFARGIFNGTAATSADDIRLAPSITKLTDLSENYVWKVVPDGQGGVYAATGDNGVIYRIDKSGASSVFFKTGELEVHSLARDSKGNVYAGTSPKGRIYKISPDGKGELVLDAPEKYVTAIVADSKDNVYAGTGDAGVLYRLADGGEKPFAKLPDPSVLSLAVDGSDNVYAGTGKGGIIYKIGQDGTVSALYNATEDSVSSLAVDSKGNVYAGTGSGKGNIYKIAMSGAAEVVYDKAPKAMSMAVDKADNVYVVSDEQIVKIMPDEVAMSLDTNRSGAQFISVAVAEDGTLFAGTANSGAVYRSSGASEGTFESLAHDAGLQSKWGKINWVADTPDGAQVAFETRTGNVAEPDSTWSAWAPVYATTAPGTSVASQSARYIQYRAKLTGSNGSTPVLKQVTIAYLTDNRQPKVALSQPQTGSVVSRTQTIKWSGSDPDKDALTYDLFLSGDSGKTWQTLGSGFKPKNGDGASEEPKKEETEEPAAESKQEEPAKVDDAGQGAPDAEDMMDQLKSELEQHPEIPQEVKDKMLAEAPNAIDKTITAASEKNDSDDAADDSDSSDGSSTKQTSYSWDTTKIDDGSYLIKIVASDRTSNAVGFLTDEKFVGPVTVSNQPPRVTAFDKDLKVEADRSVKLDGYAYHDKVAVAGVQYKVDSGEWMAAAASDGIFDSISEAYAVTTQPLSKGKHTIEVKAVDAAGNSATTKVATTVQ